MKSQESLLAGTYQSYVDPQSNGRKDYVNVLVLVLMYAACYGTLLITTDLLPYVFDNNESFSAFIHAENLYRFGFDRSFGLTDEAYGPTAEAHPYVYTHQGNFPRLFAFLLYCVGARTVEAQVLMSTFSVGLGTILLIYVFFSKVAGRLYGLIVALLFMTDYVLFAQWEVNTFKVWHGFLLFGILALIELYRERPKRIWLFLMALAALCVGYFDLLMAVFSFVLCAVYAVLRFGRGRIRDVAMSMSALAVGGGVSVAVLVLQLVGYYGWEGLRQDFYLTFVGRNYASNDARVLKEVQEFFFSNHIVFWEAFVDSKPFANIEGAVRSIFQYGFSVFTPYLTLLTIATILVPILKWVYARTPVRESGRADFYRLVPSAGLFILPILLIGPVGAVLGLLYFALTVSTTGSGTGGAGVALRNHAVVSPRAAVFLFFLSANLLAGIVVFTEAIYGGVKMSTVAIYDTDSAFSWLVILAAVLGSIMTWMTRGRVADWLRDRPIGTSAAASYFMLLSAFAFGLGSLFNTPDNSQRHIWAFVLHPWAASGSARIFALLLAGLAGYCLLTASEQARRTRRTGLGVFFLASVSAYLAAYFFSPGYMVLINLQRYTPVVVFFLIPMLAFLFYWLARRFAVSLVHTAGADAGWRGRAVFFCVSSLVLIHVVLLWIGLQKSYVELMPPDGARAFAMLKQPPYVGRSFIINSYAAPIAVKTGTWAYIDQGFVSTAAYRLEEDGYYPQVRDFYKWFSDREDPKYRNPDYAMCFAMPGFRNAEEVLNIRTFNPTRGLTLADVYHPSVDQKRKPLVLPPFACDGAFFSEKFQTPETPGPRVKTVAMDTSLLRRWKIVKLEDDFPPYLAGRQAAQVAVTLRRKNGRCAADVSYDVRQQQGKPESGTTMSAWLSPIADPARREMVYSGLAAETVTLPRGASGALYVEITPRTETRTGESVRSAGVRAHGC